MCSRETTSLWTATVSQAAPPLQRLVHTACMCMCQAVSPVCQHQGTCRVVHHAGQACRWAGLRCGTLNPVEAP